MQSEERRVPAAARRQRWLRIAAIVVIIVGAGYYFGYPYYETGRELQEAKHALDELALDEARARFEAVAAKWPSSGETTFLLARTCRLTGDFPAARQHLQEAERLAWPRQEIDLEYLLLEAQLAGKLMPATNGLQVYIKQHSPEEPLVLAALVAGGMRTNRLELTMATLGYWMRIYPNDWRPQFLRGLHLFGLGMLEPAQLDFEQALALHPGHAESHLMLGHVLQKIGYDYAQAVVHLERFLNDQTEVGRRASPQNEADALVALARSQWALNQPDVARATLDRLLTGSPQHVAGLLTLAQLEADAEHPAEALAAVHKAEAAGIVRLADLIEAVGLSAQLYRVVGTAKEAAVWEEKQKRLTADLTDLSDTLKQLRKDSSDFTHQRHVGMLYLRWGLDQEAVRWFDPILQAHPEDIETHRALADFYGKRNDANSQRLAAEHRRRAGGK